MTAVSRRSLSGPACRLGYILRSLCLFRPPDPMHSRRSSRRSQPIIHDEYLLSKLISFLTLDRFLVTCIIKRGLLKIACSLVHAPASSRLAAAEAEIEILRHADSKPQPWEIHMNHTDSIQLWLCGQHGTQ